MDDADRGGERNRGDLNRDRNEERSWELSLDPAGNPHDAFFKSVFSDPRHAVGFFRRHLPPAIAAATDWSTLRPLSGSFVEPDLKQIHSDLLYEVRIGRRDTLLYLLFEHQSTVDRSMALRLLGYMHGILRRHHARHGLPLPPVLPFVFHQGPEPWSASTAFEDLFDLPGNGEDRELLRFLPKFEHALLDLTRFDPAGEDADEVLRPVLELMKRARTGQALAFLDWLDEEARRRFPEAALLGKMFIYLLSIDESLDSETIFGRLSSNPELQREAMTAAEKLVAEGLEKGLEKGQWVGKIQALEEFLDLPVSPREALEALDADQIRARCQDLHRQYEARFKGK